MKLWIYKVTFISLLLCILTTEVSIAQQYFVDETEKRIPSLIACSSRAVFGDTDSDGDLDIYIPNTASSDYPNLLFIHEVRDSFINETSERLPYLGGYRNSFGNCGRGYCSDTR